MNPQTKLHSKKVYPKRWCYVSRNLEMDAHVDEILQLVRLAQSHGLTGMVLAAGLDDLLNKWAVYMRRLTEVRQICHAYGVEIIPSIFSVGYGNTILNGNRNLAAGVPARDVPFAVAAGQAKIIQNPDVGIKNGGFEEFSDGCFASYDYHDAPGEASFVDQTVRHSGQASIRLEGFGFDTYDPVRVVQTVSVEPYRQYRIRVWVKSEVFAPSDAFQIQVYGYSHTGKRLLVLRTLVMPPEISDWKQIAVAFNTLHYSVIRVYLGVWGGETGKVWLDDLEVHEPSLLNVLRRPGTPVSVKSEDGQITYEEGRDYESIIDQNLDPWASGDDHEGPVIRLMPRTRISPGDTLRVSYYHSVAPDEERAAICMSEPEVFDRWRSAAEILYKTLEPSTYFLSMDEIRAGGSCEACRAGGRTVGQVLADCITKQAAILREFSPGAGIYLWSDMLDPHRNAHDHYYSIDGDLTGSWDSIPNDIVAVCWKHSLREDSLGHFSGLHLRTMAATYYDTRSMATTRDWLTALQQTPGSCGLMYTTWKNDYTRLAEFGDLLK